MVGSLKLPRAFQCHKLTRVRHDANHAPISTRVAANITGVLGAEVRADGAKLDLGLGINQGLGEILHGLLRQFDEMKCKSLGAFRANAGQLFEFFDETR